MNIHQSQQQRLKMDHFNPASYQQQEILSPPTIASHQQHDLTSPISQRTAISHSSSHLIHNNQHGHLSNSNTAPPTPITVPSNSILKESYRLYENQPTSFPYPHHTSQASTPIIVSSQPQLISDNHPIVPSQRSIHKQYQQRSIEEEQERVAATTQQAMAQQYALVHEPSHVVLSQINSHAPLLHLKRTHTNTASVIKKKSRRHTVSTSSFAPPLLNIDTSNLPSSKTAPWSSSAVTVQDIHKNYFKQAPGTIALPPPTPQELGLTPPKHENPIIHKKLQAYECMTKEQLIERLLKLETEKLNKKTSSATIIVPSQQVTVASSSVQSPTLSQQKPTSAEESFTVDKDDEYEEPFQCKWKNCNQVFNTIQALTSHISEMHVGSGKNSYLCEWESCLRQLKPFSKRHKMYNHIRTHTGERPYQCDQPDCGKRFSRLDSLNTHMKVHSNIRPHPCTVTGCDKAYYHMRSLRKHERTHTTGLEHH